MDMKELLKEYQEACARKSRIWPTVFNALQKQENGEDSAPITVEQWEEFCAACDAVNTLERQLRDLPRPL